jgi:hypothetical protein
MEIKVLWNLSLFRHFQTVLFFMKWMDDKRSLLEMLQFFSLRLERRDRTDLVENHSTVATIFQPNRPC